MAFHHGTFQHTVTRRWLVRQVVEPIGYLIVSTHSHPKVAAYCYDFTLI